VAIGRKIIIKQRNLIHWRLPTYYSG